MRITRIIFALIATWLLSSAWASAQVTVERAEPVVERKSFDRTNPPRDMPKLTGSEAAKTVSFFGADTRIRAEVLDRKQVNGQHHATVRIGSIRMSLQMRVTIWLPTNANTKLINHEEGHRHIAEHYYQDAESVARALAEPMIGQTVSGSGPNEDAAIDNAIRQASEKLGRHYLDRVEVPSGRAQEEYDKITRHGTNAVGESQAIDQAIERAAGQAGRR